MIVFGIHSNFFIVLPVQLKTSVFSILQGKMCTPENLARCRGFTRPSSPDRHRARNFSRPSYALIIGKNVVVAARRRHRRCSARKSGLKNFANFTGKHLRWSLFLKKLWTFMPATLLKRDSSTAVFL